MKSEQEIREWADAWLECEPTGRSFECIGAHLHALAAVLEDPDLKRRAVDRIAELRARRD